VPRAFYATQNTLFPAVFGSIAVLLSIPFYVVGLRFLGAKGIAIAISLSEILQVVVLYMIWNKRSQNTATRPVYAFYGKMIVFSAILGPLLLWFKVHILEDIETATFAGSFLVIALTTTAFIALMAIVAYGFKVNEITDVAGQIVNKVKHTLGFS
ncbi:MAG: lipid II flippase MurJ, partial [Desulfobacterales bacterium]|nr:lipid II flippase MurJ [Desulfobacterales bacterium]